MDVAAFIVVTFIVGALTFEEAVTTVEATVFEPTIGP